MNFKTLVVVFYFVPTLCFAQSVPLPESLSYGKIRKEIKDSAQGQWIRLALGAGGRGLSRIFIPNVFGGFDRQVNITDQVGFLTAIADLCDSNTVKFRDNNRPTSIQLAGAFCQVK